MSRKRIMAAGDSSTVVLPKEVLDMMGVKAGDEIDLSVVDRTLIVRSLDEVERARKINDITDAVFERRKSAYEELAKGSE
ncbi:MAG: AbrB/MazE/SpoVT family DNA-binding domain-containing protein [Pyrinomonadaceae bacterium]